MAAPDLADGEDFQFAAIRLPCSSMVTIRSAFFSNKVFPDAGVNFKVSGLVMNETILSSDNKQRREQW